MLVSDNYFKKPITTITAVLILVLVDVGLGQNMKTKAELIKEVVLILVLVDVGLGLLHTGAVSIKNTNGLNPCFSGCWSRTRILDA